MLTFQNQGNTEVEVACSALSAFLAMSGFAAFNHFML